MKNMVYASPIYLFLDYIFDEQAVNQELKSKVLDCGAGGNRPPLGLFFENGFETHGIDKSVEQIERANTFALQNNMNLQITKGDMREIPFEDDSFDFVYEYYSICHLSKVDTAKTLMEMKRVLKKGGLLFVGFMSSECWPIVGQELLPGEFSLIEHTTPVIHDVFKDNEPDDYFKDFDILYKEKRAFRNPEMMSKFPKEEWDQLHAQMKTQYTKEEWSSLYAQRASLQNYTHLFYIVRKPS